MQGKRWGLLFEDRQVMVDDVMAEHGACALPQAVEDQALG